MGSKEYWRKREEENLRKNLKTEEEYSKAINDCYEYMLDNIQKEINGFYAKYAKKEGITLAEAKKRVSELDIEAYERKAAKYVKEKNFSDTVSKSVTTFISNIFLAKTAYSSSSPILATLSKDSISEGIQSKNIGGLFKLLSSTPCLWQTQTPESW